MHDDAGLAGGARAAGEQEGQEGVEPAEVVADATEGLLVGVEALLLEDRKIKDKSGRRDNVPVRARGPPDASRVGGRGPRRAGDAPEGIDRAPDNSLSATAASGRAFRYSCSRSAPLPPSAQITHTYT